MELYRFPPRTRGERRAYLVKLAPLRVLRRATVPLCPKTAHICWRAAAGRGDERVSLSLSLYRAAAIFEFIQAPPFEVHSVVSAEYPNELAGYLSAVGVK